jgi:hypothetical protein
MMKKERGRKQRCRFITSILLSQRKRYKNTLLFGGKIDYFLSCFSVVVVVVVVADAELDMNPLESVGVARYFVCLPSART